MKPLETHLQQIAVDGSAVNGSDTGNISSETAVDALTNESAPATNYSPNESTEGPISRLEREDPDGIDRMMHGLMMLVLLQLLAWALRIGVASWGRQQQAEREAAREAERQDGHWQRLELRRACRTWAASAAWRDLWRRVELLAEEQLLRRGFVPWAALAEARATARSRRLMADVLLRRHRLVCGLVSFRSHADQATAEQARQEAAAAAAARALEEERAAEKLQAAARQRAHDKLRASRLELWEKKTPPAPRPTTEAPRHCLPGLHHRWVRTTPSIRRMDAVVAAAQAQARSSKLPPHRTAGAARPVASLSGSVGASSPVGLRRRVTAAPSSPGSAGRANPKARSPAGAVPASPMSAASSPGMQWDRVRSLAVSNGNRAELEVLWRCRYCGQEVSLTGRQKPDP